MQYLETLFPDYFTKANRIAFIGSILFSSLALTFLLQYHPTTSKNTQKTMAILTSQSKIVSRKFSDSLSFTDIPTGDSVFNGDQIFTGENSGATVVFNDSKNVINIPAKSLIKIERDKNGELAEFIIQKDQAINVIKGNEVVSLSSEAGKGGVASVYVSGDKLILNVKSGSISLDDKATGKKETVSENENISVGDGALKKVIGFEVKSPVQDQKIDKWDGFNIALAKAEPVDIFLSENSEFNDTSLKAQVSTFPFHWVPKVQPGNYFIKIVSKSGYETVFPIVFYSSYDLSQFSPAAGETVQLNRGEKLHLKWNGGHAKKFKIQTQNYLGEENEFVTSTPSFELAGIKGNILKWSVSPMTRDGEYLAPSSKIDVSISYTGVIKLLEPADKKSFSLGEAPVHFSWDGQPNEKFKVLIKNNKTSTTAIEKIVSANVFDFVPTAVGESTFVLESLDYPNLPKLSYIFNVSSIAATWGTGLPTDFTSDEEKQKISLNFDSKITDVKSLKLLISSSTNFDPNVHGTQILSKNINYTMTKFGNYCFKITSLIPDSFVLDSEVKCIKFIEARPFANMLNPKDIVLHSKLINGIEAYSIELPPFDGAKAFELQVFKDRGATDLVISLRSTNNKMEWVSTKAGIFYYRYRVINSKKRTSDFSQMAKLIFPISPLSDWNN